MTSAYGLDLAGYSTGKSGLAFAELVEDGCQIRVTVFEKHPFAQKRKSSQRLQGILDGEVEVIRALLEHSALFVDIPIDLQGLPLADSASYIWELTKRPVDQVFGALPPLADRIGAPVARFHRIWQTLGTESDSLGVNVFETYPAASLELLGCERKGYKGRTAVLCDGKWTDKSNGDSALVRNLHKLGWTGEDGIEITDDDFDAALCAVTGVVDSICLLMEAALAEEVRKRLGREDTDPPCGYVLLKEFPCTMSVILVKKGWADRGYD